MRPEAAAVREHYDSLALIYRTFWGDHIHHGLFESPEDSPARAQVRLLEHCAALADVQPGWRVLDVGCGHAGTCIFLGQAYGCTCLGITLSEKQAAIGRENARQSGVDARVQIEVADAEEYAYPESAYELIWTMESSEHFKDKTGYLHKAAGALRPGGRLLLAAWTGSMQKPQVREVARAFLCPELVSADAYAEFIEAAGLQIIAREELGAQVRHTWEVCEQRARAAQAMAALMPRKVREFAQGIPVILDAFRSGDLTYTVMVARKPS